MNNHEYFMNRTFELAKRGWGRTNPNPLVGAIIEKDGVILAEGVHRKFGIDHAEADALKNIRSEDARGSTLYVNLEPCSHYGKTPPCAKAVIEAGISRVVIAMEDPNPRVAGRGIKMLKDAGIEAIVGVLEHEAKKLNEIFIKYITRKKPFVILKTAMTLDGKTASVTGDSRWISGELSREYVHSVRDRVSAIMVGSKTVIADNPSLTTRLETGPGKDPIRIVVDSQGLIPLESRVFGNDAPSSVNVILATTSAISPWKENQLADRGIRIIKTETADGHVDLNKLLDELAQSDIDSILLEGGGGLNAAMLKLGLVDKVLVFIAPKIIGGKDAKTPVEGDGIPCLKDALKLEDISVCQMGEDIRVEGYLKGGPQSQISCLQA